MCNFQFYMLTQILCGAGQLKNLHLEQMLGKKALTVTSNGQSTKKCFRAPVSMIMPIGIGLSTINCFFFERETTTKNIWIINK